MLAPRQVTLGQIFDLEDGEFQLVASSKGVVKLRDTTTGEYQLMYHLEFARQLPPGRPLERDDPHERSRTLAETLEAFDDTTAFLVPHFQELLDGTPAVGDIPRPQYDLAIPMSTRRTTKIKELKEFGIVFDDRTLRRRVDNLRKYGAEALLDGRKGRTEDQGVRKDSRLVKAMVELITSFGGRSTRTYTAIHAELEAKLMLDYPNAKKRPKIPSLSTVRRMVNELSGDQNPTDSAQTRETNSLAPKNHFNPRAALAPGDECQIDSTKFDCFVRMPNGQVVRPQLTILLDKCTKTIMAHLFTIGAASGYDHAVLIGRAMVPRQNRPWSHYYDSHDLPVLPWNEHLTDEQRLAYDAHQPYIIPRRLVTDNDRTYTSKVLRAVCRRYGMGITHAPVKRPAVKGGVERHFRTINTKFAQFLGGYVGPNTTKRGKKAAKEKALELRDLDELFQRWLAVVWQNKEHGGLTDPKDVSVKYTPNVWYGACVELTGHVNLPLEADEYIDLMPAEERVISTEGIRLGNAKYDSPNLVPFRKRRDTEGDSIKAVVHYDPSDPNQVWVRSPLDGEWITCPRTDVARDMRPLEVEVLERAKALSIQWSKFTNAQADRMMIALRQDVVREAEERDREHRADQKALERAKARAELPRIPRPASSVEPPAEPMRFRVV